MLKLNFFKWFSHLSRPKTDLHLITFLIFVLSFINIYYKISWKDGGFVTNENLWNPIWLLFGPLLFLSYKAILSKQIEFSKKYIFHLLPFLICSFYYIYVSLYVDMQNPWQDKFFVFYQNSYVIIAVSLALYSIFIISKILKTNERNYPDADSLIISIAVSYILICIVLVMLLIGWWIYPIDMGFDYRFLTYSLLFFCNLVIGFFWIFGDKGIENKPEYTEDFNNKSYKNSPLTDELALDYKDRITSYFENQSVYLDSKLSLETLSKELCIPKHYFSQLFNVYFEKSFHSFVAEYRILYAIELVNFNNGRLKIESLAHSCGFNSKTSFNKYFKEITGFTPSEYLVRLNKQTA